MYVCMCAHMTFFVFMENSRENKGTGIKQRPRTHFFWVASRSTISWTDRGQGGRVRLIVSNMPLLCVYDCQLYCEVAASIGKKKWRRGRGIRTKMIFFYIDTYIYRIRVLWVTCTRTHARTRCSLKAASEGISRTRTNKRTNNVVLFFL